MPENATAARRTPPEKKRRQFRVMLGIALVLLLIGLVAAVSAFWYGNERGPGADLGPETQQDLEVAEPGDGAVTPGAVPAVE